MTRATTQTKLAMGPQVSSQWCVLHAEAGTKQDRAYLALPTSIPSFANLEGTKAA
jgi:hypothetical protein